MDDFCRRNHSLKIKIHRIFSSSLSIARTEWFVTRLNDRLLPCRQYSAWVNSCLPSVVHPDCYLVGSVEITIADHAYSQPGEVYTLWAQLMEHRACGRLGRWGWRSRQLAGSVRWKRLFGNRNKRLWFAKSWSVEKVSLDIWLCDVQTYRLCWNQFLDDRCYGVNEKIPMLTNWLSGWPSEARSNALRQDVGIKGPRVLFDH